MTQLLSFSMFVIPLFLAIILHEMAHGWAALKLGDKTAQKAGRLTLNPIAHIDPVGTIFVPGFLFLSGSPFMFGWAKPVPVRFEALRDPKRDMGLVAIAGPLMNFLMAFVAVFILILFEKYLPGSFVFAWLKGNFQALFIISISLCAFNLFPMLPLDGGRIVVSLLPQKWAQTYSKTEQYGFLIFLLLLIGLPYLGRILNLNLDIIGAYMVWMRTGLLHIIDWFI